MRINHNISALNTYNRLASNQVNGNKSLEKLSSGLRINKAGDDAAGLAISEKMRSQIRGLEMASKNAQDGISLVQTAEGALGETHAILQRMREMAVQAASDTNTSDDRLSIQKEIDQLVTEVDRIANSTEFNTKKLLNGGAGVSVNWDSRTNNGTNAAWIEIVGGTADTRLGNDIAITAADYAKGATYTATVSAGNNATATGGVLTINGYSINITAGADSGAVITAINEYSEYTGVTATAGGANQVVFNATQAGSSAKLELSGLGSIDDNTTTSTTFGTDAAITSAGLGANYIANGNTITVTGGDYKGLELKLNASLMSGTAAQNLAQFDITGNGAVALQIGANSGQEMSVSIGDMRAAALGVGTIDVTTLAGAKLSIATIDSAVTQVSAERSKLGAYQNRLEHTINNLGASAENLTAAESRIRDVDMAKEMMEFTKNNILTQAATAMLAQANQAPQAVLQLLR